MGRQRHDSLIAIIDIGRLRDILLFRHRKPFHHFYFMMLFIFFDILIHFWPPVCGGRRLGSEGVEFIQAQPDGHRSAYHIQAYNMDRPAWTDPGLYSVHQNLISGSDDAPDSVMLVDVGGSISHDLKDVLQEYPEIPGRLVLQGLPIVLKNATQINRCIEKVEHEINHEQPVKGNHIPLPFQSPLHTPIRYSTGSEQRYLGSSINCLWYSHT